MKNFVFTSSILAFILAACLPTSGGAPVTQTSEVSQTSEVLPAAPQVTVTLTPTPQPQLPEKFDQAQIDSMTNDEKMAVAPEIKDLEKSNVSTVKGELVIYRDENGNAIKAYSLLTGKELSLLEAGITELDMNDGTKWELQLFTDSQEALKFIAENAEWFTGDRGEVGTKLKQDGKKEGLLQKNKSIKNIDVNSGRGDYPPFEENDRFFLMYTWEGPNGGLVLSYLVDENGGFNAIFLDDPNILGSSGALINEIRQTEFIIPEN